MVIAEVITVLKIKLKANNKIIEKTYKQLNNNFDIIEDHYFYDKALEKILRYDEKDLSLFDCVYMSLMEELGIKEIATFDEHFDKKNITRIH
jgi:predicted nucleic acid-binding protein